MNERLPCSAWVPRGQISNSSNGRRWAAEAATAAQVARRPATPAILKGAILIAVWAPLPPRWTAASPLTIRARMQHTGSVVTLASSCLPLRFTSRRLARHGSRRRAATDRHRRIPPPSSSTPPPSAFLSGHYFPSPLMLQLIALTIALIYL